MRAVLAAFLGLVTVAGCSAFVSLDGLNVPDEAGMPEAGSGMDAPADTMMMPDTGIDSPPPPACPSGKGSPMVEVNGHCIDTLETTFVQYLQFANGTSPEGGANLPPECAFKTSFTPDQVGQDLDMPVAYIDWCDAWAYCNSLGKRLCGGMNGETISDKDFKDPSKSYWMYVCSKNGMQDFPYGNSFDSTACRLTEDPEAGTDMGPVHPGTMKKCEGGYPGIFDMVGNIREWENACSGDAGATDQCRRRGAAFNEVNQPESNCAFDYESPRNVRTLSSGVRCCADKK